MAQGTKIILNPQAHRGRTGRLWQHCQRRALRELAPVELTLVEGAEEAAQEAWKSAQLGYQKIITVGGPETVHGVVNGLMRLAPGHRKAVKVGLLSVSAPEDWARTIDFPRKLEQQLAVLRAGHTLPFDLGRVDCVDGAGRPLTRHFLNGAAFGLGSRLRHEWSTHATDPLQALRGCGRMLREMLLRRTPKVLLETDEEALYRGPWTQGMVMGGRFYPLLGEVAPDADPTDGALDALWIAHGPWLTTLAQLCGLVWKGARRPATLRVDRFRAISLAGPVFLEADGQLIGRLPATFSVVPRALEMIVAPVGVRSKEPLTASRSAMPKGQLAGNLRKISGL